MRKDKRICCPRCEYRPRPDDRWWLAVVALLEGYAFAWVGHFFFEHNKPATFRYPLLSFMGDWRLWWDIVRGRIAF